jgi:hypothetical protein
LVIEKRARAAIAALGDVVGDAGDDNTSKTRHAASSHQLGRAAANTAARIIVRVYARRLSAPQLSDARMPARAPMALRGATWDVASLQL